MHRLFALSCTAALILFLSCADQSTSPEGSPRFAKGGQPGPPPGKGSPSPGQMAVSAGGRHSCGVTTAPDAYCWGRNGSGELGDGTNTASNVPVGVLDPF